jgi:hypothetical protein
MGYSIYAIVPKDLKQKVGMLIDQVKAPDEIFKGFLGGETLQANSRLSYATRYHQRKGLLVGYNYGAIGGAPRQYLFAVVTMLAREIGIPAKTKIGPIPAYYYDGEATPLFHTVDEAKASGLDYDARDADGISIGEDALFGITPTEMKILRREMERVRNLTRATVL